MILCIDGAKNCKLINSDKQICACGGGGREKLQRGIRKLRGLIDVLVILIVVVASQV